MKGDAQMPRNRAGLERHPRLAGRTVFPSAEQHGGRFDALQKPSRRFSKSAWEAERHGIRYSLTLARCLVQLRLLKARSFSQAWHEAPEEPALH